MLRSTAILLFTLLILSISGIALSSEQPALQSATLQAFNSPAMRFEPNLGQTDDRVLFLAHGADYTLFITSSEAVFSLTRPTAGAALEEKDFEGSDKLRQFDQTVLRMKIKGANPDARFEALERLQGISNYYVGKDPEKWRKGIPGFSRLVCSGVYPNTNLVYRGNQRQLEYDFILQPGSDPECIRIAFEGAKGLEIDEAGNLHICLDGEVVVQKAPMIYQEKDGKRASVEGRYFLIGDFEVGFNIAAHDKSRPLVIDPVVLYSSFIGGSNDESPGGLVVDDAGNAYLTGGTGSVDFPVTSGTMTGDGDAFILKLDPNGDIDFATFFGGSENEGSNDIAVDAAGNIYITGSSDSPDLPTTAGAYQQIFAGGFSDGYLVKLDGWGGLLYSTYFGVEERELPKEMGIPPAGSPHAGKVYITGWTKSENLATPDAYDTTLNGTSSDLFLAVFNPVGGGTSDLLYLTYLGGYASDYPYDLAVDHDGAAYLTGETSLYNDPELLPYFPTTDNAFRPMIVSFPKNFGVVDTIFIAKLNPSIPGEGGLEYSTFLIEEPDGYGYEHGTGIAVDDFGRAYVCGSCGHGLPVTQGAFDTSYNKGKIWAKTDSFIVVLNTLVAGNAGLEYCTYLGGYQQDSSTDIAIENATMGTPGDIFVVGTVFHQPDPPDNPKFITPFPTTPDAFVLDPPGATYDVWVDFPFLTKITPNGNGEADLAFSTMMSGSGDDRAFEIALDSAGTVYVTGVTNSEDFIPTTAEPYTLHGGNDIFILKIQLDGGIPPAAPSNLDATAVSNSRINLTWIDNSNNEEVFHIERSLDGINWPWNDLVYANVTSYSNESLAANTEYFYRIRAQNSAGYSDYSNIASDTTHPDGGGGDYTANMDIPVAAGSIEGTYLDTLEADDVWEGFWEKESGGKPSKRYSYLEHKWTIHIGGGSNPVLWLKVDRSAVYGVDDFVFAWSIDDSEASYENPDNIILTVDENTPMNEYHKYYGLPALLTGTIYIRVIDTDREAGNREIDGVRVDHMFIRTD